MDLGTQEATSLSCEPGGWAASGGVLEAGVRGGRELGLGTLLLIIRRREGGGFEDGLYHLAPGVEG